MKKVLLLILISVILLTGCSSSHIVVSYNATSYTDISSHIGDKVSITGYMSIVSPMDGSYAYLMNQPLNGYPMTNYDKSKLTDMLVIYPATGTSIVYTEKCVRVTGEIALPEDSESDYSWYLKNISYEVVSPSDEISAFNTAVDDGSLATLDSWLSAVYAGISDEENAEEVNATEYETKILSDGSMSSLRTIVSNLTSLTSAYNEWVKAEDKDRANVDATYTKLQTSMATWLSKLEVKGTE